MSDARAGPERGASEWTAAGVLVVLTAFLWMRGLGVHTGAGALLLLAAFVQLALVRACRAPGLCRALWWGTPLLLLLLPVMMAARLVGAAAGVRAAPADLWVGGGLWVIGALELVELLSLRLTSPSVTGANPAVGTPLDMPRQAE